MGKPAVAGSTVPVLDVGRDMDHRARQNLYGSLTFLLILAAACDAYQHLTAALGGLMDVPVVAAGRLECNVGKGNLRITHAGKIALAGEIAGIGSVGFAHGEYLLAGKLLDGSCGSLRIVVPHILGEAEGRPCLGPAGIEGYMGYGLGDLCAGDAVLFGLLHVMEQRRVGDALRYEACDCD